MACLILCFQSSGLMENMESTEIYLQKRWALRDHWGDSKVSRQEVWLLWEIAHWTDIGQSEYWDAQKMWENHLEENQGKEDRKLCFVFCNFSPSSAVVIWARPWFKLLGKKLASNIEKCVRILIIYMFQTCFSLLLSFSVDENDFSDFGAVVFNFWGLYGVSKCQ